MLYVEIWNKFQGNIVDMTTHLTNAITLVLERKHRFEGVYVENQA